jgi:hypothetical protein
MPAASFQNRESWNVKGEPPAQRRQGMIFPSPVGVVARFKGGIKMSKNGNNQAGFINSRKQPQPASGPEFSKISAKPDKTHSSGPLKISFCPIASTQLG